MVPAYQRIRTQLQNEGTLFCCRNNKTGTLEASNASRTNSVPYSSGNKTIDRKQKDHRKMGVRSLFYMVKEESPVGRDIFKHIGLSNGFRIKRTRNVIKTTWSQRVEYYPNLIQGKILNGINQVWQPDIFYIMSQGQFFYGVTIIDVYSRKLLSLHISKSLSAKSLEITMKKTLKQRTGYYLQGEYFILTA